MTTPIAHHLPASESVIANIFQTATIVLAAMLGLLTVAANF